MSIRPIQVEVTLYIGVKTDRGSRDVESAYAHAVRIAIEMDEYNTIGALCPNMIIMHSIEWLMHSASWLVPSHAAYGIHFEIQPLSQ